VSTSAIRSAAIVALALAPAACGATSHTAAPPSTASLFHELVTGYVDYARCARAHGMPNLPDPQVDTQGSDHYPSLDRRGPWRWPQSVLDGCARVWQRVHAIRDQYDSAQRPPLDSPARYTDALAVARCIRAHGFPSFPDPTASGGYSVSAVPPGFAKPNLSAAARAAIAACSRGAKQ
jgi:hypothetical protein